MGQERVCKPGDRKAEEVFSRRKNKQKYKLLGFTVTGRSGGTVNLDPVMKRVVVKSRPF